MTEPHLPGLHPNTEERVHAARFALSADWLAVLFAVALAALVRAGLFENVPW